MFDLNDELEAILKKYDLPVQPLMKDRIERAIRIVVSETVKQHGKRIIVRGLKYSPKGEYPILDVVSECGVVVAVADRKPFADEIRLKDGRIIPFIDTQKTEEPVCDVYLVNSVYNGKTICQECALSPKECYVLNLYSELRVRYGIAPFRTFDEYERERDFSHNKTHEAYLLFQKNKDAAHLEKLVSACLSNRDFVTFYEVITEAQDVTAYDSKIPALKKDIDHLLEEVRMLMEKRQANPITDVIIHWMDSVVFDDLEYLPKLNEKICGERGLFFENAYAVTPYTQAMEACIFYPDKMNRNSLHEIISSHGLLDSELYQEIMGSGYDFFMTGEMAEECRQETWNEFTQIIAASSVHYWNMLNRIIHSKKPIFGIVGCLVETHEPWMSPKTDSYNPSYEFNGRIAMSENKIRESAQYYDRVADFFSNLFPAKTIHIYMSDHGQWEDINLRRYSNYAMHTILGITNLGISGRVSRIFSFQHFADFLRQVIHCAMPEYSEHIFKDTEIRSEGFRAAILNSMEEYYECEEEMEQAYSDICCGYFGIKTAEDTYIRLDNGREIYYLGEEEWCNRVEDPKYRARIKELDERLKQRSDES